MEALYILLLLFTIGTAFSLGRRYGEWRGGIAAGMMLAKLREDHRKELLTVAAQNFHAGFVRAGGKPQQREPINGTCHRIH